MITLFLIKICRYIIERIPISNQVKLKYNNFYHAYIMKKLNRYFRASINIIKHDNIKPNNNPTNVIWVFWWQGYNNMPLVVQTCIQSIKNNSNQYKVIFLDKYNVKKYTNLPYYIYKKMYSGNIDIIHFSDIVRVNLLDNYGGLWIDSTVLCIKNITNKCFNNLYTLNAHINDNYRHFVSTKWCSFLLGGYKHSLIFQFLDTFEKLYWKDNNKLIVYFLLDYALYYAYIYNISGFNKYVNTVAFKNNLHTNSLIHIINYKYNCVTLNKIKNKTTFLKLTYKGQFNKNKNSFYSHIINN